MSDNAHEMAAHNNRAANVLWGIAGNGDGLGVSAEQQAQIVAQLRRVADCIEKEPQNIVGLVLIAGEKVPSEKGVTGHVAIVGTAPAVAAAYSVLEDVGRDAMSEMLVFMDNAVAAANAANAARTVDIDIEEVIHGASARDPRTLN